MQHDSGPGSTVEPEACGSDRPDHRIRREAEPGLADKVVGRTNTNAVCRPQLASARRRRRSGRGPGG